MENTGHVRSVNVSERKGTRKKPVESGQIHIDPHHGVTGDAHAGDWHRQVSLLAWESIEKARAMGLDVKEGDFAENITTEGMDLLALPLGTQVKIGDEVVLELSQIGKVCHKKCAIYYLAGDCIFPREGIFFEVVTGGTVSVGDSIIVTKMGDGHCKYTPQEALDEIAKVRAEEAAEKAAKAKEAAAASEFTPLAIGQDSRRASQYPGVSYSLSRPSALRVETRSDATPSQFFGVVHFVLSFNSDFARIPRMAYGASCGVCA